MRRCATIVLFALASCGTDSSAVTLPTDPIERAALCMSTALVGLETAPGAVDGRRPAAQFQEVSYYGLLVAKARHGDAVTYDHVVDSLNESVARRQSQPAFGQSRGPEVAAACRTAFPAASGQAAVALPADADEALLQCVAIARSWPALTRDNVTDFEPTLAAATGFIEPMMGEIERIAGARNASTEQQMTQILNQSFVRATGLGRPDKVIETCVRRFTRAG